MESKIRVYGKTQNRTALGIVKAYLLINPKATLKDLQNAFPDSLNPDSGVKVNFITEREAKQRQGGNWSGFFCKDGEDIVLRNGMRIFLVSMWTQPSLERLINHAKQYGIEVAPVKTSDNYNANGYHLEYLNGFVPPKVGKSKAWLWILLAVLIIAGVACLFLCNKETEPAPEPVAETVTLQPKTFTVNGVDFEMYPIQGGTFTMGCDAEEGEHVDADESPKHEVTLDPYYLGKYEVTQELWTAVMGSNPSCYKKSTQHPVDSVCWEDCQAFLAELNRLTGEQFCLPTEAQWEYAAREGKSEGRTDYSGSTEVDDVAWYSNYSDEKMRDDAMYHGKRDEFTTHGVGLKQPNEFGLYDMTGNVWEWCSDWYGDYEDAAQTNPQGPEVGTHRVVRGGCWFSTSASCRVTNRHYYLPARKSNINGLRLCWIP